MAKIIGGGGKMPSQTVGRPGYRSIKQYVGAPRKRVGLTVHAAQKSVNRLLRRDPSKYQGNAPFGGPLKAASVTTAMAGANNDLRFVAAQRGTSGNTVRVQFVVSGANTPLTIGVSGNDVTVNVATSAGSAATSTAAQVLAAVNASAPARALLEAQLAPGNDGTGVVTALSFVTLSGGVVPVVQGSMNKSTPTEVSPPLTRKDVLANARAGIKVVDKSKNRSVKKY